METTTTVAATAASNDPAALVRELNAAFEQFKDKAESKDAERDALVKADIEKLNGVISDLEASIEEANARIEASRLGGAPGAPSDPKHTEEILAYMRKGREPTVRAAMTEGTDADGGYLVPIEWDRTITDALKQRSPIRENAQVVTIRGRGFSKVYNDAVMSSGWVGETAARPETTTPGLSTLNFDTGELYANPAISQRILEDSEFDLAAWLASEVEGEFAVQENIAFLSGDGSNKPYGILTYVTGGANAARHPFGAIAAVNSANIGALAADDILALQYTLPSDFETNGKFFLNRSVMKDIRQLKDSNGNYLWQPTVAAGQPSTLSGYPVVEVPAMPSVASGNAAILFGDMERTYLVVDRAGVTVLRDPFTNKPFVHFYTTKRVGGGVQNPESMKALVIA